MFYSAPKHFSKPVFAALLLLASALSAFALPPGTAPKKQKVFGLPALANRLAQSDLTVLGYTSSTEAEPLHLVRVLLKDSSYALGLDFLALMINCEQSLELNYFLTPDANQASAAVFFTDVIKSNQFTKEQEVEMYMLLEEIVKHNTLRRSMGMQPLLVLGLNNIQTYDENGNVEELEEIEQAELTTQDNIITIPNDSLLNNLLSKNSTSSSPAAMATIILDARTGNLVAQMDPELPIVKYEKGLALVPLNQALRKSRSNKHPLDANNLPSLQPSLVSTLTGEDVRYVIQNKTQKLKSHQLPEEIQQEAAQTKKDYLGFLEEFFKAGKVQTIWVQTHRETAVLSENAPEIDSVLAEISKSALSKNETNFLLVPTRDRTIAPMLKAHQLDELQSNIDAVLIYSSTSLKAEEAAACVIPLTPWNLSSNGTESKDQN